MPEIKNTFLAGKMNKSLDDRLVPEGEYRDALNIQVTKSEGADVGVIQNLKGNTNISNLTLTGGSKVIGTCFDEQNNDIYWFVTNNTASYLYKYNKDLGDDPSNPSIILQDTDNDILNFNTDDFIQANIVENYLFFTDGRNEPRRIDVSDPSKYTSFAESDITVAKLAPQFAPDITVEEVDSTGAANYIEEKFVRFAYRYKFSDNTYSVYSPFSNTVFAINSDTLTELQIRDAYSKGTLDFLINTARKINIQPKTPIGGTTNWSTFDIQQVDILLKASDSPAVLLIDSIKDTDLDSAFVYNSEKPKFALPENQLTRVFDTVPKSAIAQEIVGNRVVYGNFKQGFNIDTTTKLPFTLTTVDKTINTDGNSYLNYLGVKSNRTYEIGIVFSDDYGRTSPVVFGQNKAVYLNKSVQENYNKQLALSFTNNLQSIIDAGFKYYSVVVKQSEQEYYNVYTPGFGSVNGRSYFALFGDNINKIPIDTSTYNTDTNINTTSTRVYLSLENQALVDAGATVTDTFDLEAFEYTFESQQQYTRFISNITNVIAYTNTNTLIQNINGTDHNTGQSTVDVDPSNPAVYTLEVPIGTNPHNVIRITESPAGSEQIDIGLTLAENSGIDLYVDGVKKSPSIDYIYDKTATPLPTITFTSGNIPESGQEIAVFLKYNNLTIPENSTNSFLSLSDIGGTISITKEVGSYTITLPTSPQELPFIPPTTPFAAGNLDELKVTGISIRNNFGPLAGETGDIQTNSVEDLNGIYKIDSNYLLAEIDGLYGVPFYTAGTPDEIKYADLAILETKPFESTIDIYYETATQGLISSLGNGVEIPINYYNCINLKAPARGADTNIVWQESRIKGGFNEASMDYGVQAYLANEDYGLITRKSSLIYSGILNNNTKVNNTNQFPSGENIVRTLDPVYGSIQKLYADTDDLLIFQEEKVSQALIDKDVIYTAEGQALTTAGVNVISQVNAYATNYGIGVYPESFAVYAGRKYFVDKPKGAVLRLSRDGITEISNYGMRSEFRNILSNGNITGIVGGWDMYNKEYIVSIQGSTYSASEYGSANITLGYDESNNGWTSRYSYIPELAGSLDGDFYTFYQGNLYKHNTNALHNNFYGTQYASFVDIIFNQNPSANKNFLTINYEGSETWNINNVTTDTDSGQNIAAYSIANDDLIISGFKKYDNKYFANIINAATSVNSNEVVLGSSMSGIKGYFAKLRIQTTDTGYKELFSVSTNYNVNSY